MNSTYDDVCCIICGRIDKPEDFRECSECQENICESCFIGDENICESCRQ